MRRRFRQTAASPCLPQRNRTKPRPKRVKLDVARTFPINRLTKRNELSMRQLLFKGCRRMALFGRSALWGANGIVGRKYDVLAVWRDRATQVSGKALPSGHWLTEEVPEQTLAEVTRFLAT